MPRPGRVGAIAATAPITMTASQTHTALQLIAASNRRVVVEQIEVSMNGITAADPPILISVSLQTDAGTMSSLTPVKFFPSDPESLGLTAQHTATGEPTTTDLRWSGYYHEMTGGVIPLKNIPIAGGTRLGIIYTAGTLTATTKIAVSALCEE